MAVIYQYMVEEIKNAGGRIDGMLYCTSITEEDNQRKPGTGLFEDILRDYPDVDPSKALMVGDGDIDIDKEFLRGVTVFLFALLIF